MAKMGWVAAALVSGMSALTACSGSVSVGGGDLSSSEVASTVTKSFNDKFSVTATVTCPDRDALASGDALDCTLTLPNGDQTGVAVSIGEDDQVDWNAPGVVDVSAVVDQITSKLASGPGINATVDCGEDTLWAGDGTKQCEMTGEEAQGVIKVDLNDDGTIKWHLL